MLLKFGSSLVGSRLANTLAVVLAALVLACRNDGTGPRVAASGLSLVAGSTATDTVDAQLVQALVVEVGDESGLAIPGVVARFTALPVRRPDGVVVAGALVGRLSAAGKGTLVVDTTDVRGRAAALVQLGPVAGEVGVEVSVPELGLADTARFTVLHGSADSIGLTPADSALFIAAHYVLTAQVLDRYNNVTGDAVGFSAVNASVADVSGATVTAKAYGRAAIVASAGGVRDTAWTSVVPFGVLGVSAPGPAGIIVSTVNLDGSGFAQIPVAHTYTGAGLAWAPDGSYLVGGFDSDARALYRVTPAGVSTLVVPSGTSVGQITAVDVSADGQWIYFSAGNCNYNEIVYRVSLAGGGPQRVSAPVGDECFDMVQADVSLAPDGLQAVVDHYATPYAPSELQVVDIATGQATPLNIIGSHPKWSPRGDRIAFVDNGRVWVVSPDGSGANAISPLNMLFQPGLTWSPDGEWLVVHHQAISWNSTTQLVLLRVATREMIPLPPSFARWDNPAWNPAP